MKLRVFQRTFCPDQNSSGFEVVEYNVLKTKKNLKGQA